MSPEDATQTYDVAIVGYGPVGQVLTNLLGDAGHRVLTVERWPELYPRPRAAHFDHEIHRVLDQLGVVDKLGDDVVAMRSYDWRGADGELILRIKADGVGASGFPIGHLFYQPTLEAALHERAEALPNVELMRGWEVRHLQSDGAGGATFTAERMKVAGPGLLGGTGDTRTVAARYVVGADGANSMVRRAAGIDMTDLGFAENWLVCDVAFANHDLADGLFSELGDSTQWCDPSRPHMSARVGRYHRRWEFMLLPGENPADFVSRDSVWARLSPWLTPEMAELERYVVYQFSSKVADRMRGGSTLLVGDAAHVMPPFIGQGLCSGIRDAANLAWKLDLVLKGKSPNSLLDTVGEERREQIMQTIGVSLRMGRVSCTLDPAAARDRDQAFRQGRMPPPEDLPGLAGGIRYRPGGRDVDLLAGSLGVQGLVKAAHGSGLADAVVGYGFCLIVASGDLRSYLDITDPGSPLQQLGGHIITLDPMVPGAVMDIDGRLTSWMDNAGVAAVLVRPDFYVFGSVQELSELPALLSDLQAQLSAHLPAPTPA